MSEEKPSLCGIIEEKRRNQIKSKWQIIFPGENFKSKIKLNRYLQLMFNVTVVSRRWPSGIARFHTTHRYFAPSSSRCGVTDNVLVVWRSFDPPRLIGACNGIALPSRYQLKLVTKYTHTHWWNLYQIHERLWLLNWLVTLQISTKFNPISAWFVIW